MKESLVVHGGVNALRARAAAFLVQEQPSRFEKIIFSGGKTAGIDKPSEAENMRSIFLARLRVIAPELDLSPQILLEEESCDTQQNAENTIDRVEKQDLGNIVLLSNASHGPRLKDAYSRYGLDNLKFISAESVFATLGTPLQKRYIQKYNYSLPVVKSALLEIPLFLLSKTERGRKMIRNRTQKRIVDTLEDFFSPGKENPAYFFQKQPRDILDAVTGLLNYLDTCHNQKSPPGEKYLLFARSIVAFLHTEGAYAYLAASDRYTLETSEAFGSLRAHLDTTTIIK